MSYSNCGPARILAGGSGQRGFSLPQLLAALLVLAVLAALGMAKLSQFLRQKTLKGEAQGLVGLMRQTRSLGLKKGIAVKVVFDRAGGSLRVYGDADMDGAWEAGEQVRDVAMSRDIVFGTGSNPPPLGPRGGAIPRDGLEGTWSSGLVFARDAMATPGVGAAYLHHARMDGWAACLIRPADSQQILAYLWDGHAWRAL